MNNAIKNPMNTCPYWVGDVFISFAETEPSARWPGTSWTRITDCFLRAADDEHPAGSTGGAWEHTQTIAEIAAHSPFLPNANLNGSVTVPAWGGYVKDGSVIASDGSSESGNHNGWWLPTIGNSEPMDITNTYTAVNMWRRVA